MNTDTSVSVAMSFDVWLAPEGRGLGMPMLTRNFYFIDGEKYYPAKLGLDKRGN